MLKHFIAYREHPWNNKLLPKSIAALPFKSYFYLNGIEPLAFCGISGFLMEAMHINPVYTPPFLRNRGYAKAITAGAILQRHQEQPSLEQAVLIVENPAAERAYQAIGFTKISDYQLALVREDYRHSHAMAL